MRFIKGRQRDQMDAFPDGSKALASAAARVYTRGAASGGGRRAEGEVGGWGGGGLTDYT